MKQLKLFEMKKQNEFGGSLLVGRRRDRRPLDRKKPTHIVLKATNSLRLLQNRSTVESVLRKYAEKLGVKIYELAVHADHIHVAVLSDRESYVRWIRAITSVLVQMIPGLKWKLRPFTRIVNWGRDLIQLLKYITKNRDESKLIRAFADRVRNFAITSRRSPLLGDSRKARNSRMNRVDRLHRE